MVVAVFSLKYMLLFDMMCGIFVCDICHGVVDSNRDDESVCRSANRMQRLNDQVAKILEGMRRSEEMTMPMCVPRPSLRHPAPTERPQVRRLGAYRGAVCRPSGREKPWRRRRRRANDRRGVRVQSEGQEPERRDLA
jgi:hypothetical protein